MFLSRDFPQKMASALSENPASVIHSLNLAHNTLDNQGTGPHSVDSVSLPPPSLSGNLWMFFWLLLRRGFCLFSKNSNSVSVLKDDLFPVPRCFHLRLSFMSLSLYLWLLLLFGEMLSFFFTIAHNLPHKLSLLCSSARAHSWKQTHTHTHTHTQLYMNHYTPFPYVSVKEMTVRVCGLDLCASLISEFLSSCLTHVSSTHFNSLLVTPTATCVCVCVCVSVWWSVYALTVCVITDYKKVLQPSSQ